jgi:thiamine biosynthesis lipoprotein
MAAEHRFRAMGCDARVVVVGGAPHLGRWARARIADLERRWSRFLPTSDVSVLNRGTGFPVRVSSETTELVQRAVEAWRVTGGWFDPTVLGAVVRAGYDRSFDEVRACPRVGSSTLDGGADLIEITGDLVRMPPGVGFDPGGIGKGLAADIVADEMRAQGAEGVCVDLGGDVRVTGVAPEGGTWTIVVDHPRLGALARLDLEDGAVATSTTLLRRWEIDGRMQHHLIDPTTGRPAERAHVFATVVTGRTWTAEVLAKTLLVRPGPDPLVTLPDHADGLLVDDSGRVTMSDGLHRFLPAPAR